MDRAPYNDIKFQNFVEHSQECNNTYIYMKDSLQQKWTLQVPFFLCKPKNIEAMWCGTGKCTKFVATLYKSIGSC